ncbi:MAG: hypothetical protein CVU86_06120 [Firmicutes bacterium HGW-Firmicutes-11]|jgi:hypothetical protein|nr:MAG: hypothetical protein CVU86_06120 [Firmicutes bacterium HGW-Firmicutes-11]
MRKSVLALIVLAVLLFGTVFASAATDPDVTIVSPGETVYGSNLLVSIKMTAPKKIKVYLFEEKEKVGDTLVSIDPSAGGSLENKTLQSVSVIVPETYTGTGNLQFFNKQITDLNPGLYRIKVDTLDTAGAMTASSSSRFLMMEAASAPTSTEIFQTQPSGALQWVQNLLKTLFGN